MNTILDAAKRLNPVVTEQLDTWECQVETEYGQLKYKNYLFKTENGEEVEFSDYELGLVEYPVIEWARHSGPRNIQQMTLHTKVIECLEEALESVPTQIIINDPCWDDHFEAILSTEVHVETFDGEYVFSLAELTVQFKEKYPNFKIGEKPTIYVRVWNGLVANVWINDPALEHVALVLIDEDVRNENTGEDYTVTDYTYDGVVNGLDDIIEML
jgi:hypothetical protein